MLDSWLLLVSVVRIFHMAYFKLPIWCCQMWSPEKTLMILVSKEQQGPAYDWPSPDIIAVDNSFKCLGAGWCKYQDPHLLYSCVHSFATGDKDLLWKLPKRTSAFDTHKNPQSLVIPPPGSKTKAVNSKLHLYSHCYTYIFKYPNNFTYKDIIFLWHCPQVLPVKSWWLDQRLTLYHKTLRMTFFVHWGVTEPVLKPHLVLLDDSWHHFS